MPETNPSLAGDLLRRRATRALLIGLCALPPTVWLFRAVPDLWASILTLDGAPFMLWAMLMGLGMAVGPLLAFGGLLLALWWGVDAVYKPRSRSTPRTDRIIVAVALFVWSLPTLGFVGQAAWALYSGRVHFVRPPRDYFLATDPVAYWQGIGFWLIMGGIIGFLSWRYWQPRLRGSALSQD